MEGILESNTEISEVLRTVYTLRGHDLHVDPVPVCGVVRHAATLLGASSHSSYRSPKRLRALTQRLTRRYERFLGHRQE